MNTYKEMLRSTSYVRALPSVEKTVTSAARSGFQTYATDALVYMNDYNPEQSLDVGNPYQQELQKMWQET